MKEAFRRGLDQKFVKALNKRYEADSWWRKLVDDEETFVAIRDSSVNVYYRGNSLLKLDWNENKETMAGQVHYKYLLRPEIEGSQYVEVVDGKAKPPRDAMFCDIGNVKALKAASRVYAGDEKAGVHEIVLKRSNVIDVEIAFRGSGLRVDLAALHETDDGPQLVFYEAKHFSNKELRAEEGREAKVIGQLDGYSGLLEKNKGQLEECYQRVCENLRCIKGLAGRHPQRHDMLVRVLDEGLRVDPKPRLVVFGFDQDQQRGAWKRHRERLAQSFQEKERRIRGWGNPADVRLDW